MTEDPRDILRRTLYIDQDIQRLQAEQRQLEDRLTCLQGFDYSKPVVQGSGSRGSLETLAAEAADLQDRIARRITALIQAKRERNGGAVYPAAGLAVSRRGLGV